MPTGRMSGCLSSAIRRPDIYAQYAAQGGLPLANQITKVSMLVRSLVRLYQHFRSHPCNTSESVTPGPEPTKILCTTNSMASSMMFTGVKIYVSSFVSNVAQEGIVFARMFYFQKRWDGIVDCACTILSQFVWLQTSTLFPAIDKSDGFAQFFFQYEVQERSMKLLLRLILTSFSEVSHRGIVHVFHNLVKHPTIPATQSKQYALTPFLQKL